MWSDTEWLNTNPYCHGCWYSEVRKADVKIDIFNLNGSAVSCPRHPGVVPHARLGQVTAQLAETTPSDSVNLEVDRPTQILIHDCVKFEQTTGIRIGCSVVQSFRWVFQLQLLNAGVPHVWKIPL